MGALFRDVRHAARSLARTPGFTAVALVTLALGIGANTAIFSIVNGVALRPLPYPNPDQLMYLTTRFPQQGFTQFWVSAPEYMEFRRLTQSFAAVGAYTTGEANIMAGDRPLRVRSASVDEHLFAALGIQTAHGRLFGPGETNRGDVTISGQPLTPLPPIVILSYELWQSAFGGQPMVGRTIEVLGRRREVIGILPPGADVKDNRTEIWLPIGLNPASPGNRAGHFLYLIGRLKEGVTADAAQAELNTLLQNWGERVGATDHVFAPASADIGDPNLETGHILQMTPLDDQMLGGIRRLMWVLQAAVGLVLLIACANLANLLLARAEARRREFGVRSALGAGRWRLFRQFVTEGVLLSVVGGALGVWLARFGVQAFVRAYPMSLPRTNEVAVDDAALVFTFAVAAATGIAFGLTPLLHSRIDGLVSALNEAGGKGHTGRFAGRFRRGLVTAQVAMAVVVIVGAALLIRTVYNLMAVDAGFDRSRLVTFSITLPPVTYPQPSARRQAYQEILDRVRSIPGVQAATAMDGLPPNRPLTANGTDIESYTAPPDGPFELVDYYRTVMSDYFETMGIPIVQGRGFQLTDAASGLVAVANETFVSTFLRGQNPIGQRVQPFFGVKTPWITVVGVAKDVKQGGIDRPTGTELYFLIDQLANRPPLAFAPATMNVVVRTALPATTLAPAVERVVRDVDRTVPVVRLREMEAVFAESVQRPRLLAQLLGAFAGLALLLAVIGTYGVLAYTVAERRREIGIRMALGAARANVLAHVLKQGLSLTAAGIVLGLAGAFALNRLIASLLFGVQPTDVMTFGAVTVTVVLVSTLASCLPAWRASRVDPLVALRSE